MVVIVISSVIQRGFNSFTIWDSLHIWIVMFYGIVESNVVSLVIGFVTILISNCNHFQFEWLRVSQRGSQFAPFWSCWTSCKFNPIKSFLQIQLINWLISHKLMKRHGLIYIYILTCTNAAIWRVLTSSWWLKPLLNTHIGSIPRSSASYIQE